MQTFLQRVESGNARTWHSAIAVYIPKDRMSFAAHPFNYSQLYGIILAASSILIHKRKFIGQQEIAAPF